MYLGIDVGGTFTDGVLLDGSRVVKVVKSPTRQRELSRSLTEVLEELLLDVSPADIERAVISTTLVTNLIATDQAPQAAMVLVPGPGMPFSSYKMFPNTYFIKGAIDFRGRVVEELDLAKLDRVVNEIGRSGIENVAVVAKFSNRNPSFEKSIAEKIVAKHPDINVVCGSDVAARLNFRRRIATSYYTARTSMAWAKFADEIALSFKNRGIMCELQIMKADGGTMPLTISRKHPCETIFSGPAASCVGAIALTMEKVNAVVMDIGGTTTDISLLLDGQALKASRGAVLAGEYTHIDSFSVHSVPLGGDSIISITPDGLNLLPRIDEGAACFGGSRTTVTDVFNCKYDLSIGDAGKSQASLETTAREAGVDAECLADQVVDYVLSRLEKEIRAISSEWENEPAYRVWEVVNSRKFNISEILGIGAAASSIVPILGQRISANTCIHPLSGSANAVGACVARPTLRCHVHIDTSSRKFTIDQGNTQGVLDSGHMQLAGARELAIQNLIELAKSRGIGDYADEYEIFFEEQFNVVRGYSTSGRLFEIGIQITPGLVKGFKGVQM